jgi:hypothetical protein
MLGLMSVLSRRERAELSHQLDAHIATSLRPFSRVQQRQAAFEAMQQQAGALPAVVTQLQALVEQVQRRGEQLDEQLLARQSRFLDSASEAYQGLARSVQQSLKDGLEGSARSAAHSLSSVVNEAMGGIAQEASRQHERLNAAVQSQLQGLTERFGATANEVADTWAAALQAHARTSEQQAQGLERALQAFTAQFEARSAALVESVQDSMGRTQAEHSAVERERHLAWTQALQAAGESLQSQWRELGAQTLAQQQAVAQALADTATRWREELASLRSEEAARGQAAVQRLVEMQGSLSEQMAQQLEKLGGAFEAPMARLIETAAEAPQAAADMLAQRREEMAQLAERDNSALQERAALLQHIDTLLQRVQQGTGEQAAAIESLVASAGSVLDRVGQQFADTVGVQAVRAEEVATQVNVSAIELASLGEAFGHGVELFSASNEKLMENLQRIENAVTQSIARSDEQLAYYVAQAREVIDLSISAQQGIVEDLRRLRAEAQARAAA